MTTRPRRVRISAPSHVHLGNFDLCGDLGRLFGTIGFTLEEPRLVLELEPSTEPRAEGPYADLVLDYMRKVMELLNVGPAHVRVLSSFRRGVGLGLTTAVALSVAWGLCRLYGVDVNILDIAPRLGRGLVSALGTYGFVYGGMIVDAGFRINEPLSRVPPLIARLEIPREWTFLIVVPENVPKQVAKIKSAEAEVLRSLPKMSQELSGRLCRIVLMKLIPSVLEQDIEKFGEAVTEFNKLAGTYWAPFQEGRLYCSPEVEEGIQLLLDNGAVGAAQSCWGPTFYGIFRSVEDAEKAARIVQSRIRCRIYITHVDNRGATAEVVID